MSYIYLPSNNITVFPAGFRGQDWYQAKITTEQNLRTFAGYSKHNENNKFFIEDPNNSNNYVLSIKGYYFSFLKTHLSTLISSSTLSGDIYAQITLRRDDTAAVGYILDVTEDTSAQVTNSNYLLDVKNSTSNEYEFRGLGFYATSTTPEDNSTTYHYHLKIGNKDDSTFTPILQPLRYSIDEIRIDQINEETNSPLSLRDIFVPEDLSLGKASTIVKNASNVTKKIDNIPLPTIFVKNKYTQRLTSQVISAAQADEADHAGYADNAKTIYIEDERTNSSLSGYKKLQIVDSLPTELPLSTNDLNTIYIILEHETINENEN